MKMKKKRCLSILLSLVLVLGLLQGMSLMAYAEDDPYSSIKNTTTVVHFDNKDWYLIDYDTDTVTLLSKNLVAVSQYNRRFYAEYSDNPIIKGVVDNYYTNSITSDVKKAVNGDRMFILTMDQAYATTEEIRKCSVYGDSGINDWWTCTEGIQENYVVCVSGSYGTIESFGDWVVNTRGVRPALKLDRSSVVFFPESTTFMLRQTIAAEDVTATYGDMNKRVSASVTDPAAGGGEISYAVTEGSEDYIDVDSVTGHLTIKKVPADGKAYVTVTAAEIGAYGEATRNVTIMINKAPCVPAEVAANDRNYDGTEAPLLTVTGEAIGGEMQYGIGNAMFPPQEYSSDIPVGKEPGIYYVWYKVAGDEYHNDSKPEQVIVKISDGQLNCDIIPEDAVVSFPDGVEFHVEVLDPDQVASYQWYDIDIQKQVTKMTGESAKTDTLKILSTDPGMNGFQFYCVITDKNGNTFETRKATLTIDNPQEAKTVLYAGEYAIEPGEKLDISTTPLGSGELSFDENGTDITLDSVVMDNQWWSADDIMPEAVLIEIFNYHTLTEQYNINIKGDNVLTNYFDQPDGNGISFRMYDPGEEEILPRYVFAGDGTLTIEGGEHAMYATASMEIGVPVKAVPKTGFKSCIQAEQHITVGSGSKLDLTAEGGAALMAGTGLTMEPGSAINVQATAPQYGKCSIIDVIGDVSLNQAAVDIKGVAKPSNSESGPYIGFSVSSESDVSIENSKINIDLSAEPRKKPNAFLFTGFDAGKNASIKESDVAVRICSDDIVGATGIYADGILAITDSNVSVTCRTQDLQQGIKSYGELQITNSNVTSDVFSTTGDDSLGINCGKATVSLSGDYKVSSTVNAGIAFSANNGAGKKEKGYVPGYTSKKIALENDTFCVKPVANEVSTASIPGTVHDYVYLETFYNSDDTSKPANSVVIQRAADISGAKVTLAKTSVTYNGKYQKPEVKSVVLDGKKLTSGKDYIVRYSNNKNAGKATVKIFGKGLYAGSASASFTIKKAAQPMTVKAAKAKTLKASAVKAKKQVVKNTVIVKKNQGAVTYSKVKVSKKKYAKNFTVNKNTGAITVTKGTPKGTYTITVKVSAKGNKNYKAGSKSAAVIIVIK